MSSNRAVEFAKLQADRARRQWNLQQIKRRTAVLARLESSGTYIGYQADVELHQIRLLSGKTVLAESITNSGLDIGDAVAVSGGNGRWKFKAMPR